MDIKEMSLREVLNYLKEERGYTYKEIAKKLELNHVYIIQLANNSNMLKNEVRMKRKILSEFKEEL